MRLSHRLALAMAGLALATAVGLHEVAPLGAAPVLAVVLAAIGMALLIARSLSRPLVEMTRAVQAFSRGDETQVLQARGGREIETLAAAFNRVMSEMRSRGEALRTRTEKSERLLETSPDLIVVMDANCVLTRVSPSARAIVGYEPSELIERRIGDIADPSDPESIAREARAARAGRSKMQFRSRLIRKDGALVPIAWTGTWSEINRRYVLFGRDLTSEQLSEDKFRVALEAAPTGIVMIDEDGRLSLVNTLVERMFGYPRDELVGQPFEMLAPAPTRLALARFRRRFAARLFVRSRAGGREFEGLRKDGRTIPLRVAVNTLPTPKGGLLLATLADMTEARRAQGELEALAARDRLLSAAVAASSEATITTSRDRRITSWNPAAERMFGYSAEEAIGLSGRIFAPEGGADEGADWAAQVLAGEPIERRESKRRRKSGEIFPVEFSLSPIRDAAGAIVGAVSVCRDITERKATEAELKALSDRDLLFSAAVAATSEAIVTTSRDHKITAWNPAAERMIGYSAAEALGKSLEMVIPEEMRAQFRMAAPRVFQGQSVEAMETLRLRRNGELFPAEVSVFPIRDRGGEIVGAAAISRDITERKKVEAELRKLTERDRLFSAAVESSEDAVGTVSTDLIMTGWNPAAERLLGYTAEEVVGKPIFNVVGEAHREASRQMLRKVISGLPVRQMDAVRSRKDGSPIHISISASPIRNADGEILGAVMISRDIGEKLATEARLRETQKMEAIGQLTGGIAHDFNNLLTVIIGTIDMVAAGVEDRPHLLKITRLIDDAAQRGARMTDQLLSFSRRQPLRPREADVNALVSNLLVLLRPTLGERIHIVARLADDPPMAMVDEGQLANALLNCAFNARDAMPTGGELTISTSRALHAAGDGDPTLESYALITIADTGVGMSRQVIERAFEPFFTTKDVGKGTGLGLSMVYGFVRQTKGHVEIESELGRGTKIHIFLPRASLDEQERAEVAADSALGGPETILLVEDDALVRESVANQIRSLGYQVVATGNSREAIAHIEEGKQVDLLFTDVIMADSLKGPELAAEARKRRPDLRVLYTSGYAEDAAFGEARAEAGVLLLSKPYRKSELAQMIRRALRG